MPDSLEARLALNLRTARSARSWTQFDAAAASGLHLRHYQKLEAAEVNVTLRTLTRLAEALRVDATWLLGRSESRRG